MSDPTDELKSCCGRGGARPGCGRKPGIKTRPVRLPLWLLDALEEQGEVRHAIIEACIQRYGIEPPTESESERSDD